jgi:hypothetical protein
VEFGCCNGLLASYQPRDLAPLVGEYSIVHGHGAERQDAKQNNS